MMPDVQTLYDVTDRTWPPARWIDAPGFTLREGRGGGQRVSAATARPGCTGADITQAEAAMRGLDQPALFMIREGDDELDAQLADRGYVIKDPVNLYAAPVGLLTDKPLPRVTAFTIWEPLAIQYDMWKSAGIGPGRWAVMARAKMPKTSILARWKEQPAGTAYAAIHHGIAMIHAIEVVPHLQRQGAGGWIMRGFAHWAAEAGAHHVALAVTQANTAANGLYASLGLTLVGQYHYRIAKD